MLQEEAILLQNQDSYRLPQYIENPKYGPAEDKILGMML